MKKWNISFQTVNPPIPNRIPQTLEYLRNYVMDMAYIPKEADSEKAKTCKRNIYKTLRMMNNADVPPQEMRISRMWPQANWRQIWRNLTVAPTSEDDKAVWYRTIRDIHPTNERLHRIKISPTDKCNACGVEDTVLHRLVECGHGPLMWEWVQKVIARMLRTIPERIPKEWLLRPQLNPWPSQRNAATLWVLARYITFRITKQRDLTLQDLMDFYRRAKWKLYQAPESHRRVANILTVLDNTP
jgi:hypothetical protein